MTKSIMNEDFDGTFPFKPNYEEINGFQMHYVDEGKGEVIVCVHGEPTWGYLYRNFIADLSKDFRVIVPDHMGFGKSEVPLNKKYIMEEHVDNLEKLILILDLQDITLVFQDWGGPIALGFATRNPERVKRLVIMNTSVGIAREGQKLWYDALVEKGQYDQILGDIEVFVPSFMIPIFRRKIPFKEKKIIKKAYMAPFPTAESHIGVKAFPLDIPKGDNHPSSKIMREVRNNLNLLDKKAKIIVWGMKDAIFPPKFIEWWKKIYPYIKAYEIENAGHFLQEDAPEEIIKIIRGFIKQNP